MAFMIFWLGGVLFIAAFMINTTLRRIADALEKKAGR